MKNEHDIFTFCFRHYPVWWNCRMPCDVGWKTFLDYKIPELHSMHAKAVILFYQTISPSVSHSEHNRNMTMRQQSYGALA